MYILLRAKWLILNLIFFITCTTGFAINSDYQNNLSNLEIQKIGESSLGITIYTDEPYNEPLQVVKKSDTQYFLLLPETSNSASKSLIESDLKTRSGGLVENVEFKHFSYPNSGANNGYTKVIITTSQPVGIAAAAKTLPVVAKVAPSTETDIKRKESTSPKKIVKEKVETKGESGIQLSENEKKTPEFRTEFKKVQPHNPIEQKAIAQKTIEKKQQIKNAPVAKKASAKKTITKSVTKTKKETIVTPTVAKAIETTSENLPDVSVQKTQPSEEQFFAEDIPPTSIQTELSTEQEHQLTPPYSNEEARLAFQKENFLMLAGLLFMVFIIFLSKKVNARRLQAQQSATSQPKRQYPKKKIKQSKLQKDLLKIMDNTNLSWQERYELLKLREANEENRKLKKTFTQKEIQELADRHSPQDDIYTQNQNKFIENRQIPTEHKINTDVPKVTNIQNYSSESENKKNVDKQKITSTEPDEKKGIMPQQRVMGIQGNIRGYAHKVVTPKIQTQQVDDPPELLAQVKIDNNKGFYLTKFANQLSLIGYVGENVFVLKKFGTKNVRTLQARLNESEPNKQTYIVKVDNYKALVEVKDKMQLILEL